MNRKNHRSPKKRKNPRRKQSRQPRTKHGFRNRRVKQRSIRSNRPTDPRVARALGSMRREGLSASKAARHEGMKLNTFRKGAGRFLSRTGPGKPWKARSEDQLRFSMSVLTPKGRVEVIVRNSRERKLLHDYESAVRMFRATEDGAEEELKKFAGKKISGHELITDVKLLIELEEAAELDFESLYSPFGGKS